MKTKIKLYLLFLLGVLISGAVIYNTYALFETNIDYDSELAVGKWLIKINDKDIGTTKKIVLSNLNYTQSTKIDDSYIAPGRSGYVDIVLDPTGTEVAVRYDITFDSDAIGKDNITYTVTLPNGNTLVKTDANTHTGVLTLDDLKTTSSITLRVNVNWEDIEEYNESDTEMGKEYENTVSIPISFKFSQYLGERIEEYQE